MNIASTGLALTLLFLSCEKVQSPTPTREPTLAKKTPERGSHVLVKPTSRVYRSPKHDHVAFVVQDQPMLFQLLSWDDDAVRIRTLTHHEDNGCYPPAQGTTGLNIELSVSPDSVATVSTTPTTHELAPGIIATMNPGAWAIDGELRTSKLSVRSKPSVGKSFDILPQPTYTKPAYQENVPSHLQPFARKFQAGGYIFQKTQATDELLVIVDDCVRIAWDGPKSSGPPKEEDGWSYGVLGGIIEDTPAIHRGAFVYYHDGSRAGTVQEKRYVHPIEVLSGPGKVCNWFAGTHGVDPNASNSWVLCFDDPNK